MRISDRVPEDAGNSRSSKVSETTAHPKYAPTGDRSRIGSFDQDQISVSPLRELALDAVQSATARRNDRVEQLRIQYEAGNYNIDAGALSGALVDAMIHGDEGVAPTFA